MFTYALRDAHSIGWETGGGFLLFLFCLILLWIYRRKEPDAAGFFLPFVPASMLVVYFPLFADAVRKAFQTGSVYIRMHWLFFMIPATAAAMTVVIGSERLRIRRWIPFLLLILIVHPHAFGYFALAENAYKIPDAAVQVSDMIMDDCGETPVRVMIQWHENASPGFNDDTSDSSEFHYGIRMYASNLILSYCIITEDRWNAEGFDLAAYINSTYDYVVCRNEPVLTEGCLSLGYEALGEAGDYRVFCHADSVGAEAVDEAVES